MFSSRLPLTDLIELCRVLRHQLSAGISLQRVLQQQSERGRASFRAMAARLSDAIRQGSSFSDALDKEPGAFPPLFLSMVKVGESTGHIAEIFGELESYYQLELQLRRQFRSQTILPIIQFVAAVVIMAGVIYILGLIASLNNAKPLIDIFGLSGGAGDEGADRLCGGRGVVLRGGVHHLGDLSLGKHLFGGARREVLTINPALQTRAY
jgi:hypothetical protein